MAASKQARTLKHFRNAVLLVWGLLRLVPTMHAWLYEAQMEEDEQPSKIEPRDPTLGCQSSDHWATTTELQPPVILSIDTALLAGRAW